MLNPDGSSAASSPQAVAQWEELERFVESRLRRSNTPARAGVVATRLTVSNTCSILGFTTIGTRPIPRQPVRCWKAWPMPAAGRTSRRRSGFGSPPNCSRCAAPNAGRPPTGPSTPGRRSGRKIAAALSISLGRAGSALNYGLAMRRLPAVAAVFEAGDIDLDLYRVIVFRTGLVDDPDATAHIETG